MNSTLEHAEKWKKLNRKAEAIQIYDQYSQWARHFHLLVWTITAFGYTISLGGFTLIEKVLTKWGILGLGIGGILIVVLTYHLANTNKKQENYYLYVLNALEATWGFRDADNNKTGPLFVSDENFKKGATKNARRIFTFAIIIAWVIVMLVKLQCSCWI